MFKKWIGSALLGLALVLAAVPVVQAGALSDYLENKLVDHVFRAQAYTAPTTVYVALFTSACSDSAIGTEVSGGSYARPGLATSLVNWAGTQAAASTTASSGTSGTTSNNAAITFATPSAGWGTVTHIGLMDSVSSGNMLVCTALSIGKTINTGDTVSFPAASLTIQMDN
ncbi:phage tail fiber protein [Rhodoferax fermentans]|uniref:Uncharacterized protein n=1 Tax=Rhodoferax fermentans TaxID=28066 RepID=A0A1T1AP30_RHOFE|nr:hypothetical protein RF819_02735 [Rhodoferax fermentans]